MKKFIVSDENSVVYETPLLRIYPTRYFIGIRKEDNKVLYLPIIKKVFCSKDWKTNGKRYKFIEV